MKKLVANISAKVIGIIVFLFGLLLLSTSVLGVFKCHNDINCSLEGFAIVVGILGLFFTGFYFMWVGYSILFLKRIAFISIMLLSIIPSIIILTIFYEFAESVWEKPEEGYSFLSKTVLLLLFIIVFSGSFFLIGTALMNIFRRLTDKT